MYANMEETEYTLPPDGRQIKSKLENNKAIKLCDYHDTEIFKDIQIF